jgi:hypothetical protein
MQLPRLNADDGTRSLRREILLVLAIKLLVLVGIWIAFFSRPAIDSMTAGMDPGRVAAAIAPVSTPAPEDSRP